MTHKVLLSLLLSAAGLSANAQNATSRSQLCPTPPMGWMTWNLFKGDINEQLIRETADAMVSEGLAAAGYKYIFIDDLWQGGRDMHNNIIPDPQKFSLKKKLGTAKVICKPPVLVPKTAQNSSLSKLGEMAHV